jgi:cysteine desulfurase
MNDSIKYYDAAATTPVDPRVLEKMTPYFSEIFGNASSNHAYGREAKKAIEEARHYVAELINAEDSEIYFTSGATESINWAIKGILEANPDKGNHIITVKTEHKAVLKTCEFLETKGYEVTYLNVDENGLIQFGELEDSITENTCMICVMYVNNEIGVIQDIPKIGKLAREKEIVFFCDATQAVGKIPVDVLNDQIDML